MYPPYGYGQGGYQQPPFEYLRYGTQPYEGMPPYNGVPYAENYQTQPMYGYPPQYNAYYPYHGMPYPSYPTMPYNYMGTNYNNKLERFPTPQPQTNQDTYGGINNLSTGTSGYPSYNQGEKYYNNQYGTYQSSTSNKNNK